MEYKGFEDALKKMFEQNEKMDLHKLTGGEFPDDLKEFILERDAGCS